MLFLFSFCFAAEKKADFLSPISMQQRTKYVFFRAKTTKERLHSVNKNSNFEIAAFFHHLNGKGKSAAISKLELLNGVVLILSLL